MGVEAVNDPYRILMNILMDVCPITKIYQQLGCTV